MASADVTDAAAQHLAATLSAATYAATRRVRSDDDSRVLLLGARMKRPLP